MSPGSGLHEAGASSFTSGQQASHPGLDRAAAFRRSQKRRSRVARIGPKAASGAGGSGLWFHCTVVVWPRGPGDRKSTRLNSSHVKISYAVFCLKKKKASHIPDIHDTVDTLSTSSRHA